MPNPEKSAPRVVAAVVANIAAAAAVVVAAVAAIKPGFRSVEPAMGGLHLFGWAAFFAGLWMLPSCSEQPKVIAES